MFFAFLQVSHIKHASGSKGIHLMGASFHMLPYHLFLHVTYLWQDFS